MLATTSSIKNWPRSDRPCNKLLEGQPDDLTNSELLAVLIWNGNSQRNALDLAMELLAMCQNNVVELCKCSKKDLMRIKGIGPAKATTLLATFEFARRRQSTSPPDRLYLSNSRESAAYIRPMFAGSKKYEFGAIYLTQAGWVIMWEFLAEGDGIGAIQPRRILKTALEKYAVSIILVSYRPSGNAFPAKAEEQLTYRINTAAKSMDIKLLDHIILNAGTYFSFADNGLMPCA